MEIELEIIEITEAEITESQRRAGDLFVASLCETDPAELPAKETD